eukprot:TRINITY_DN1919_c0_g1_i2.p1 TRINITY_DN1919_c0_g1~~TRINITY_DN1919_c0_g1_i2.p1  ORF type:complete len:217 (-),score=45.27 TRINITY_DN1919_c0_g1_i2:253-903(-)
MCIRDSNYTILHVVEKSLSNIPIVHFKSGYYGPDHAWGEWFYQLNIWLVIVLVAKTVVVLIILPHRDWLDWVGDIALGPVEVSPRLELILVMVIIPIIVNSCSLWITDNFLKLTTKGEASITVEKAKETLKDSLSANDYYTFDQNIAKQHSANGTHHMNNSDYNFANHTGANGGTEKENDPESGDESELLVDQDICSSTKCTQKTRTSFPRPNSVN